MFDAMDKSAEKSDCFRMGQHARVTKWDGPVDVSGVGPEGVQGHAGRYCGNQQFSRMVCKTEQSRFDGQAGPESHGE